MARATARIHRNFLFANLDFGSTAGQAASLSDVAFEFLEDSEGWPESFSSGGGRDENEAILDGEEEDEDDQEKNPNSTEENNNFWETQHQNLHVNYILSLLSFRKKFSNQPNGGLHMV